MISHVIYIIVTQIPFITNSLQFFFAVMTPRPHSRSAKLRGNKRIVDSDSSSVEQSSKKAYDSDNLDEDSDDLSKKRKRATPKKTQSPRKKTRRKDENEEYEELTEGQEIVGVVVQAPKTGQVPHGQISQNTLDFLTNLKDPACNDREWCVVAIQIFQSF